MKITICALASERYWNDRAALDSAFAAIVREMAGIDGAARLVTCDLDAAEIEPGDLLVAIPMSGAVQQFATDIARKFDTVCVYPGYVSGNLGDAVSRQMLLLNAAPAAMEIYSVVKRTGRCYMCPDRAELARIVRAATSLSALRHSKLLLIGDIEPWVLTADRDLDVYKKRLGVTIERLPLDDMAAMYRAVSESEAAALYDEWRGGADSIAEPSDGDIMNAARFCVAFRRIIEKHGADGAAIACFNLLQMLGTTACLAVSYINGSTDYVAACEGDVDSAVTMLALRRLTDSRLWMANPNLQNDGTVNFVHCTAPVNAGGGRCGYVLRNHHESGIGVSPAVTFPDDLTLTACRISDGASKITIQKATGKNGGHEPTCRTQYRVKFDDYERYIRTVLGCHQVFAFDDVTREMGLLAEMLGLETL